MEQWPSRTLLLIMTKGKKALEGLALAIINFGSEMALHHFIFSLTGQN